MTAGPVIRPGGCSWSKMSGMAEHPVQADRREQRGRGGAATAPATSTTIITERPSAGDVAGGDERRGERQQRQRQRRVDVVRDVAQVGERRQQDDHDRDEHVEREHAVQRVRRAQQQQAARRTAAASPSRTAMSRTRSGIAQATTLPLRALVTRAGGAPGPRPGSLASTRWTISTSRSSSTSTGNSSGASPVSTPHSATPWREPVVRAGSRRSPGCPPPPGRSATTRQLPTDHLDRRSAPSSRATAPRATGRGPARRARGAGAARTASTSAEQDPASDVARRQARQHEQVDAPSAPAPGRPGAVIRRPPASDRGGVVAEREQRLGPHARARGRTSASTATSACCGHALGAPGPLPAPELELVDLEHVDERQRAAEEERARAAAGLVRPRRGTARACRRTRRRAARRRR